jgi:ubiquinone/menaquinone biosynthesis C-methylase UbiE/uncharacterized protein YbaR (Trm112 family)
MEILTSPECKNDLQEKTGHKNDHETRGETLFSHECSTTDTTEDSIAILLPPDLADFSSIEDPELPETTIKMIACPICKNGLQAIGKKLFCKECSVTYTTEDGIPILLPPAIDDSSLNEDMESPETKVKKYYIGKEKYDWVTDVRYPEKLFHDAREREIVKFIKRHGHGQRFLDLGCGTGLITRHIDFEYVLAMDINRWAIGKAKSRVSPNVSFVVGDIENIPLTSNTFDMVTCTDVLEHLSNPCQALHEIHRTMKDGATFIGTVPSRNLIWNFRNFITTTCPVSEPFHHNYNLSEIKALLSIFDSVRLHRCASGLEWLFTARK